ncbi:bifunctional adenosylcobinamide kinase/adenosylcobinamide-phosphate guanylyltransferase [Pseudalkalibacillus decolorationis]|uniref:bifunctional adenosylcobinamide kinase/adenosylcobinamide-phosphate guanylyltransferase n=1 Tax=Pseudalkalibacillus decolorationis TaxID=163879 RepID=UPI002147D844|nr:bifunctional adenosylcobinamide kinase/adenosylcobinamide-phosphate guanylyltransferase [Pseudalkalibacillus decolorationis]
MHFVTGGAFNGKRAWVLKTLITERSNLSWISAYDGLTLPNDLTHIQEGTIVLEGIEMWIKELTTNYPIQQCRNLWNDRLIKWSQWEHSHGNRNVILIGTDTSKGIVPLEKEDRTWRDVTGWCYQDLASKSDQIDVIWYGIKQKIK